MPVRVDGYYSYRPSTVLFTCIRVALEGMLKEERPFGEILQRALQILPEDQVGLQTLGRSVIFQNSPDHQRELYLSPGWLIGKFGGGFC